MQTTPKLYTDIDYESFPIADLDLDRHWIQLPNSVLAARRQAKLLALEQERAKTLPEDHKVILVPADPAHRGRPLARLHPHRPPVPDQVSRSPPRRQCRHRSPPRRTPRLA